MMNKNQIIALSISLGVIYSITLACLGVFGALISSFFMLWVPATLKTIGVVLGLVFVVFLPIRVFYAVEQNKKRSSELIMKLKRDREEMKAKELNKVAESTEKIDFYD